jgi:hypothetical protein
MKTFIHEDWLRCVNFGDNVEAAAKFYARAKREVSEVKDLQRRGFPMHEAWILVKTQRVVN